MTTTRVDASLHVPEQPGDDIIVAGPIRVDVGRHEVHLYEREILFTVRELALLVYLIRQQGRVASAEEISAAVWQAPTNTNTVTVHINRLRTKLGDDPQHGVMIRTVRGVGYRLAPSLCETHLDATG